MKAAFISVLVLSIGLNVLFLFKHSCSSADILNQRQLSLGLMEQDLNSLVNMLTNNDAGHNKAADPVVRKAYERRFVGIGFIYWANAVDSSQIAVSPVFEAAFRVHADLIQEDAMKQHLADPLIVDAWKSRSLADAVLAAWNCTVVPEKIIRNEKSYASSIEAFCNWVRQLRKVPEKK